MTAGSEFPHLPAGREPGPQSIRTRRRRDVLSPFVGFVGLAMFVAGVWVAAGGRGARFDRTEELLGGLFFAAMGLLALYVPLVVWRNREERYGALRGVTLSVTAATARRGEEVSVTVTSDGPVADGLEVGLACDEREDVEVRTNVTVVEETAEKTVWEEWRGVPDGAREHTIAFRIPTDAPPSHEGDAISHAWRVSARVVRAGRPDARLDEPIWVEP